MAAMRASHTRRFYARQRRRFRRDCACFLSAPMTTAQLKILKCRATRYFITPRFHGEIGYRHDAHDFSSPICITPIGASSAYSQPITSAISRAIRDDGHRSDVDAFPPNTYARSSRARAKISSTSGADAIQHECRCRRLYFNYVPHAPSFF